MKYLLLIGVEFTLAYSFNLMKCFLKEEECFSSYLQRLAKIYYANNHDIWRKIAREGVHYPQAQISKSIDITPHTIIDLAKVEKLLHLTENQVNRASFHKVYNLFSIPRDKMAHSNLLIKCVNSYRNYCPICLQEEEKYKLMWQVKEMSFCNIHHVKLYDRCWYCNKQIPILPANSQIAICPYCNSKLYIAPIHRVEIEFEDTKRIEEDWEYLLGDEIVKFQPFNGCNVGQTIALKLMAISNDSNNAYLLQKARNTSVSNSEFSLVNLLGLVRKYKVSLKAFFKFQLPNQFVNKVISPNKMSIENYSCLAPWCKNYQKKGKLCRTSTSSRKKKDGTVDNFYMYCPECSIEYCVCNGDKRLKERGYFIDLAWHSVRNRIENTASIKQLAVDLACTEDIIKRCIIFLATNKLIDLKDCKLPLKLPIKTDDLKLNEFCENIKKVNNIKEIKKLMGLYYNEFLFYRMNAKARLENIRNKIARPDKKQDNYPKYAKKIHESIKKCRVRNIPITINRISMMTNICPETIRKYGFFNTIKEEKNMQTEVIRNKEREKLRILAKEIIDQAISTGQTIDSTALYKRLGCSRTFLARKYPDLTKYIYELLKDYRRKKTCMYQLEK